MPRPLKTYSWTWHAFSPQEVRIATNDGAEPWKRQLRMIVASTSKAAAARLVKDEPRRLFNMGDTGNKVETALAEARPGTVFIAPLDRAREPGDYEEWIPWGRFKEEE